MTALAALSIEDLRTELADWRAHGYDTPKEVNDALMRVLDKGRQVADHHDLLRIENEALKAKQAQAEFTTTLLALVARLDIRDELSWHAHGDGTLAFCVMCSDTFGWGCADAEDVTPETLPELVRALADAQAAAASLYTGVTLYCCRQRQQRPHNIMHVYQDNPALLALFEACGPALPSAPA